MASAVLMVAVSQSLNLNGSTLRATGKAQLRDGLNAAINADLEQIRHTIAGWAQSERSDGQLACAPSAQACNFGRLGTALLAEQHNDLPSSSTVTPIDAPEKVGLVRIERTISTSTTNSNSIVINYTTSSDSPVSIKQQTTLAIPAQGWWVQTPDMRHITILIKALHQWGVGVGSGEAQINHPCQVPHY